MDVCSRTSGSEFKETGITGREVARLANINHRTALLVLENLLQIDIVHRLIGGRDHIFTLNREPLFCGESHFYALYRGSELHRRNI